MTAPHTTLTRASRRPANRTPKPARREPAMRGPERVARRLAMRAARVIAAASEGPPRRVRDERGVASVWTMIVVTTAFVGLMALVGGGGELINERVEARRAAEQAARAGADELSASAVRSGTDQVDAGKAIARANGVLRQAGWSGSVRVEGSRVVVTVNDTRSPQFLSLIGVGAMQINETGSADAISTPDG